MSEKSPFRFWPLQLGGWAAFGAAMFIAGISHWQLHYTVVHKSSLTIFGFVVSTLLRYPYRALRRRGVPLPILVAISLPLSYLGAGVWMALHNVAVDVFARGRAPLATFPDFTNTIYYSFVLAAWSLLYFGIDAYAEQQRDRERLLRMEALAHEARLRALRLQLNPHFLFNTLNAVSTLVSEGKSAEANRMISRLSDYLRSALESPDADEVPLTDEIAFAQQYLDIEKVRFGERLHVEVDVGPGAAGALVPSMILQPLVENAVRHAVWPRVAGGSISIVARRDADFVTVGVHDDGPGIDASAPRSSGVGLSNTHQRLAEMYGALSELRLARSEQGGLAVSIRLPYREVAEAAS